MKFLIVEKKGKAQSFTAKGASKYEVLKQFANKNSNYGLYWNGSTPYVSTLYGGTGSRQFVAVKQG